MSVLTEEAAKQVQLNSGKKGMATALCIGIRSVTCSKLIFCASCVLSLALWQKFAVSLLGFLFVHRIISEVPVY